MLGVRCSVFDVFLFCIGRPPAAAAGLNTEYSLVLRLAAAFALLLVAGCRPAWPEKAADAGRPPSLYPDYTELVIPANIAPLNFIVREQGVRFSARLAGDRGRALTLSSRNGKIRFPAGPWRELLEQNRGAALRLDVAAQDPDGAWHRFQTVTNRIASEDLDRYLVYRLIPPMDHLWKRIGIYQRDLSGFDVRPVIENQSFSVDRNGCVNCHSFRMNRTDRMSFQIRSASFGKPMMVARDGVVSKVDTTAAGFSKGPAGYHSWHPDGRRIAFSVNKVSPFEHTRGEHRDVWDNDSDLAVYLVASNLVVSVPDLSDPARRETWPAWSADGRHLYFCSAPQVPFERFLDVRYDLMRIPYDPLTGAWGEREVLAAAADTEMSAAQPRASPDGRWLLFSLSDHGSFPIFQPSCDLYLLDLTNGLLRCLDINSEWSDSWHCWSSNGRWIAFSSKREGGVLARVYFSYFDPDGREHKPFVMPQEDPAFYESLTLTFNVPELVTAPVPVRPAQWGRAIAAKEPVLKPGFAGKKGGESQAPPSNLEPWQPASGR